MNLPKKKVTEIVQNFKAYPEVDRGGTEEFSELTLNNNKIVFLPKKKHVGEYIIRVYSKFISLHLNFSMNYTLHLTVLDLPPNLPPPGTLGERVRFQIEKISKKGAVTVKVKPKLTNMLLT